MTGLVKICGLSRPEHAEAAARAGADLIGFVFADSRRRVEPATARAAIERAKAISPAIRTVGLFVHAEVETIQRVQEASGVDLVQVHGMPDARTVERTGLPTLIVVRDTPGQRADDLLEYVTAISESGLVEMVHFDAYHPTMAGGTGTLANWALAAVLSRQVPLILAGGLNPANVADAISAVRPVAVDVSSGVERGGTKDPDLIQEFVTNAKAAFAGIGQSISSGTSSHDAP